MNIAVIGMGYVGVVTASCLADIGHSVIGIDIDLEKVENLKRGKVTLFEANLENMITRNLKNERLVFSNDIALGVLKSQVIFLCIGTPPNPDGSVDLSQVEEVVKEVMVQMNEYKIIVTKSTVPVGTGKWIEKTINQYLNNKIDFDVVSNPEFLAEGKAVEDFFQPDRIIVGTSSSRAQNLMFEVYKEIIITNKVPFITTSIETAELIKYASNAFLAIKISYINEMSNLCEVLGVDITELARGIGLDKRIGDSFLNAGPGFGGSCFPKDTKAIISIAQKYEQKISLVDTAVNINETHKQRIIKKIKKLISSLDQKTLAILGLAFKSNTDDVRESPALYIIDRLLAEGALIKVHDPVATKNVKQIYGSKIKYCNDPYETIKGADAVLIVTEWDSYRNLDLKKIKSLLKSPNFIDLRNLYSPSEVEVFGMRYEGIGRGREVQPCGRPAIVEDYCAISS